MIHEIEEHFRKEYPREGCGIIGIVAGKKEWFPCTNIAERDKDFIVSPDEYFKIKQKADIFAIVHSHVDQSNEPSECDINNCNALGIPYYIYSYPDMELNVVEPKKRVDPLIGREYDFGVLDCFEACRDYYQELGLSFPNRHMFKEKWWEDGGQTDYMTDEGAAEWGFYPVESPQKNDLIIFRINSSVNNHIGVYLQDDVFFHHAQHRLSCRENLYPYWAKYVVGFYRHEA